MKNALAIAGVFVTGIGVGVFLERTAPFARAGEGPRCAPLLVSGGAVVQDMNGDGMFDPIAEALRLLTWAFQGGPAPVAPCPAGVPSGFPATGEKTCWRDAGSPAGWLPVPCEGTDCPGQDGFYQSGCPFEGRFIDNGDGTVTDHCAGLVWLKDPPGSKEDGIPDRFTWCEALAYCESLVLSGHDDWRLPNLHELQSLIDFGRRGLFPVDPTFGIRRLEGAFGWYWSATSAFSHPGKAYLVTFEENPVMEFIQSDPKEYNHFILPVRSST